MKVLWALILLIALSAAGMVLFRQMGGSHQGSATQAAAPTQPATVPTPSTSVKTPPAQSAPVQPPAPPVTGSTKVDAPPASNQATDIPKAPVFTNETQQPHKTTETKPQDKPQDKPVEPTPAETAAAPVPVTPEPKPEPAKTNEAKPETTSPTTPASTSTKPETNSVVPATTPATPSGVPATPSPTGDPSVPPASHTGVPPPPQEYKLSDAPAKPHTVVTNADGSIRVDDRFTIKGDGSAEKPYQITWDLLVSASEEYSPREGRTELPKRITMFNGKYVQIEGNIAFPLMMEEPQELLSMLNQWDGCCIGVPPTPYDAVEVKLTKAVRGPDRLASFGIVKGKLKVEPQLVGKWLVALYAMDAAELTPKGYGGFTP